MRKKKYLNRIMAAVLSAAMIFSYMPANASAAGEDPAQGPVAVVDYDVTQIADGKLIDKSGKGNDATVVGNNVKPNGTYIEITGNDSYIELPTSIMSSLTDKESFTIETTYTKADNNSPSWLFNIGSIPKLTGTNYMFFCPEFFDAEPRIGIKDSSNNEQFVNGAPKLDDETEYTVKMTFNHGDVTVEVNGWSGTTETGFSMMKDIVIPGTANDILGYIGRSCWSGDAMFNGTIRSFKIYDDAYGTEVESPEDIFKAEGFTATESLEIKAGRTDNIEVTLPDGVYAGYDAEVSYKSGNDEIATVDEEGKVTGVSKGETEITTTVKVGNVPPQSKVTKVTVSAADIAVDPDDPVKRVAPVYMNDFSKGLDGASMLVTGLGSYGGQAEYTEDGLDGRALALGNYGLKLNLPDLGNKYTVSMWVKPNGALPDNMSILFLGYHDPEKWFGIAGGDIGDGSVVKIWTHNNVDVSLGVRWQVIKYGSAIPGDWTMFTLSSDGEDLSIYQNGELISKTNDAAAKNAMDALTGENQDIYVGVTSWDAEFDGSVDSVRVYQDSLTDDEVKGIFDYDVKNNPVIEQRFREKVDSITPDMIIGSDNISEDEIRYDLDLPSSISGLDITWESSNPDVISNSGVVTNGDADAEVTLKATITSGGFKAEKDFTLTVKAIDKSELGTMVDTAKVINPAYLTAGSATALNNALSSAESVLNESKSQKEVRQTQLLLRRVLGKLVFNETYLNPWSELEGAAPDIKTEINVGATSDIFSIPESIKELVDVEYISSDAGTVKYEDGTITGVKAGRATVSAVVTAKSDGWIMEYSTIVTVKEEAAAQADAAAVTVSEPAVKAIASEGSTDVIVNNSSATVSKESTAKIKAKKSVKKGDTIKLKVKGIKGKVKWSVSDSSRAVIKKNKLKAKKAGKVVVTAEVAGVTLQKTIKIKK